MLRSAAPLVLALLTICNANHASAEPLLYIPATLENTTLIDGTSLAENQGNEIWKWLPDEGNQGVFESGGESTKDAPILKIAVSGLKPGSDYEVFGFFWTNGFDSNPATHAGQPQHWTARLGLGLATLTTFGGRPVDSAPWILSPDSEIANRLGLTVAVEADKPLVQQISDWVTAAGDTRLIRARLGIARADQHGSLPVYADDYQQNKLSVKTRIDGVGLRILPAGDYDSVGAGKPGHLHLAVRAGDTLNMRRELAAGADVNALDEDGVTALLYPATSGNLEMVRELLKAGADPNRPEQSILPITGAASWGDAEMLKLLLDAGAEVPSKVPDRPPILEETLDPARLHPAMAAIRAGSLVCLKLILAQKPDLNLMALEPEVEKSKRLQHWELPDQMVVKAIRKRHDALAAFLVERGCTVSDPHIIADCIGFGESMAKTREALLRNGTPAIQPIPYNAHSMEYGNEVFVKPWDALSAAVYSGNLDMTRRFLPLAKNVDERYLRALHSLADVCGKAEILAALKSNGLGRPVVEGKILSAEPRENDETSARFFLPRLGAKTAPPKSSTGTWTVAVIPAPEAADAAAIVEAAASNNSRWQVVDRSLIETALMEDRNAKPWEKGEHQLSGLGDRLSADVILVVTKLGGDKIALLRFEAIDVVSGLVVHRQYAEEKSLNTDESIDTLLAGIEAAMGRARASQHPLAVSLLTFTADKSLPLSGSLATQFKAAMENAVDDTPGMLTVGMNEINAIAREQNLRGEGSFWAAAYTIEGGISPVSGTRVALTLRLRNLTGVAERPVDTTVEGSADDIPTLAEGAWQRLLESQTIRSGAENQERPDRQQAALEATRLAREAEWLLACRRPGEARPLAERAALLGASPEMIVPVILRSLLHEIPLASRYDFTSADTLLPLSLPYQQAMIGRLDTICELAERTETLFLKHGGDIPHWKKEPMLFVEMIRKLCYIRSVIPEHLLTRDQAEKFDSFCTGMDRMIPDCLGAMARALKTHEHLSEPTPVYFINTSTSSRMLKSNSDLAKGFCKIAFSKFKEDKAPYIDPIDEMLHHLLYRSTRQTPDAMETIGIMVMEIKKQIRSLPEEHRSRVEFYCALMTSRGDTVPMLIRNQQKAALEAGRHSPLARSYGPTSRLQNSNYGLREYFQVTKGGLPARRNFVLQSIFQQPAGWPDAIVRLGYLPRDSSGWQNNLLRIEMSKTPRADHDRFKQAFIDSLSKQLRDSLVDTQFVQHAHLGIEALSLLDLMYGVVVQEPIRNEWMKLTEKLAPGASVTPRMMTDLRLGPASAMGIFDHYAADSSASGHLWLRYRPHENGLCVTNGARLRNAELKESGTWLYGIHCGTGAIEISTSLHTFIELKGDNRQATMWATYEDTFIAQNSSVILTQVGWVDPRDQESWRAAYALIDKATGKPGPLVKELTIKAFDTWPRHQTAFAEVIDDAFFLIAHREASRNPNARRELIRLDETGTLESITKIGRRPELSPFDAEDRTPEGLIEDQGSLIVYDRSKQHIARYKPKEQSWTPIDIDDQAKSGLLIDSTQKALTHRTRSTSMVKMPDGQGMLQINGGPGIWPDEEVDAPSLLRITQPGKDNLELPLEFDFPTDYAKEARFLDGAYSFNNKQIPEQEFSLEQLQEQRRLHVVVLHQTESDLIVGLRIKSMQPSSFGASRAFLPFLWALSKDQLLRHLRN